LSNDAKSNDFIFIKSKTDSKTHEKSTYGTKGIEIPYEPWEGEEDWVDKGIEEQITSTISNVKTKKLIDDERVYVVLGLSTSYNPRKDGKPVKVHVFNVDVKQVLTQLSAKILAYLNPEHSKLLVSCPFSSLAEILESEKYDSKYFHNVKRISPLTFKEQVSGDLRQDNEWRTATKPILIQLVPNLPNQIRQQYVTEIMEYLQKSLAEPIDYDNTGFITASLNREAATELLQTSNFVLKISEIPQGVLEKLRVTKRRSHVRSKFVVEGATSSMDTENSASSNLPIICLMDSGVNDIPPLNGLVIQKDGYLFNDLGDGGKNDGHGTPVACLAIYGEELSNPKARIISYKIFSEDQKQLDVRAYQQAIAKYSNQAHIFLSSINFKRENPNITAYLDNLIQANNICVVLSAGNILDKQKILDYAFNGVPCSSYVHNHPVQDPAPAINIMAVGAISKKEAPNSISRKNELAPFTTCGVTKGSLYKCPKPEVVQNGGNYCKDEKSLGLESFNKFGSRVDTFAGTSFSAPLLARNLAEIEAKYGEDYGGRIQNAETLKAIALASARRGEHVCMGFGETKPFFICDDAHALVYSEGEIPLIDRTLKKYYTESKGIIALRIPKAVCSIDLFIVHSDNNYMTVIPCLNTYLKVYAHKEGNEKSTVQLKNPEELEKKAHMKVFRWAFSRTSMEGKWIFTIVPEPTVDMLPEHQKNTKVRYGCAILVTSRTPKRIIPLSEELRIKNRYLEG